MAHVLIIYNATAISNLIMLALSSSDVPLSLFMVAMKQMILTTDKDEYCIEARSRNLLCKQEVRTPMIKQCLRLHGHFLFQTLMLQITIY